MNFDYKRMLKYELNVGEKEKRNRIAVGVVLIFISLFTASIILLLIGLILIATGYFGFCPVYAGLGKNTCSSDSANNE
jgi:cadmium resistance protein CadD (predicted permease)